MLNVDYKIIAKVLANRIKTFLPKLINEDQKGFVSGRNIQDANRLIQDIIENSDMNNEEGSIIFLDQEKAFDRVEWEWIYKCLNGFNFGEKYIKWIIMILEKSKTCINTNGFVSEYFEISRSARQGCPISPLLYIIQSEPLACTIRANTDIQGMQLPNGKSVKINLFADDTQLFNKNENSIKECFKTIN